MNGMLKFTVVNNGDCPVINDPKRSPPSGRKSNYTASISAAFSINSFHKITPLCALANHKLLVSKAQLKWESASNIKLKAFSGSQISNEEITLET